MREYFSDLGLAELQKRHPALCEERARYEPKKVRDRLRKDGGFQRKKVLPYVLFPFDARWIYYESEAKFLNEARPELGTHLVEGNEFLVGAPQPRRVSESRPLILRSLFDLHLHDWGSVGFPAEVNPAEHEGELFKPKQEDLVPSANLAEGAWNAWHAAWNLKGDLRGKSAKALCRALFRYCAAIAHSPRYEADHKDSLLQGWPRVPIAKDKADFDEVVRLGEQLAILLDPLSDATESIKAIVGKDAKTLALVSRVGGGAVKQSELRGRIQLLRGSYGRWNERPPSEPESLRPEWGDATGDLYLNDSVFLANVPREIWRYELGGYPVVKKWLGYRQANRRNNRALLLSELDELRGIVLRVAALLSLRAKLDTAYEKVTSAAWTLDELSLASTQSQVEAPA